MILMTFCLKNIFSSCSIGSEGRRMQIFSEAERNFYLCIPKNWNVRKKWHSARRWTTREMRHARLLRRSDRCDICFELDFGLFKWQSSLILSREKEFLFCRCFRIFRKSFIKKSKVLPKNAPSGLKSFHPRILTGCAIRYRRLHHSPPRQTKGRFLYKWNQR